MATKQQVEEATEVEAYEGSKQELSDTAFAIFCARVARSNEMSDRGFRHMIEQSYDAAKVWLELAPPIAEAMMADRALSTED